MIGTAGCTTTEERTNYTPPHGKSEPRTVQIFAGSSLKRKPTAGPLDDNPYLRDDLAAAFRHRFPNLQVVESRPDMVVYFNIVDYVPGCAPNCQKFRTYRNWNCEVEVFWRSEPTTQTLVFNWGGSTYNPLYDPTANCAARFAKALRQ